MIYALMGYLHAVAARRARAIRALAAGERGQGTVEYVGLTVIVCPRSTVGIRPSRLVLGRRRADP